MELVTTALVSQTHKAEPYTVAAIAPRIEKGRGERVLASTMVQSAPYGTFTYGLGQQRWRQVLLAYRSVYYLGTRARCQEIGSHRPLAAFVSSGGDRSTRQKFIRTYGVKSQHAVRPHEVVEPLGPDHPLERLFDRPNQWDHGGISDILEEIELFLCLCGSAYLWVVPDVNTGYPSELFVIPSQWVYGPFVDRNAEDGLSFYEVRPLIGQGVLRIPHEEIIFFQEKSPIHKLVGWAPTQAISEWIDSLDSIMTARYFMMKNGAFPMGAVELEKGYYDPDDEDMDRIREKFFSRIQGETRYGTPLILPPGAKYNPLAIAPTEMAFDASANNLRDWILASLQVPKEIVGLQEAGSEIAMYGPLTQFCRPIRFRLNKIAAVLTRCLASRWDSSIRVWFNDPVPESPEEVRAKWTMLAQLGWAAPNEGRAEFGLEAWENGNNPLLPAGVLPYPLAKDDDLTFLDDLAPTPAGKGKEDGSEESPMGFGEADGSHHVPGKPPEFTKPDDGAKESANGKTSAAVEERLAILEKAWQIRQPVLSIAHTNGHVREKGRWVTFEPSGTHVFLDDASSIEYGPSHMIGRKPHELGQRVAHDHGPNHPLTGTPKAPKPAGDFKPSAPTKPAKPAADTRKPGSEAKPSGEPATPKPVKPAVPKPGENNGSGSNGSGGGATGNGVPPVSGGVAQETGGPADSGANQIGANAAKPAGSGTTARVPAHVEHVNKKLDRYGDFFRKKGQHQAADWMGKLKDHVNTVGVEEALTALGEEVHGAGEEVQYAGFNLEGNADPHFVESYLNANGITLAQSDFDPNTKVVSTVSPSSDEEGVHPRGDERDVFPQLQTLRDKLHEAQHLPGLEKSEDLSKLMGGEMGGAVKEFTPQVIDKLDSTYGKGQWIVKSYGDEAYAGFGIFFPQRVAQIKKDAQNTIWSAGEQVSRHGFELARNDAGKVVGLKHHGGETYEFGTPKYNNTIHGDVRHWGDKAAAVASAEMATPLPVDDKGQTVKRFMAQPAFPVVGISNEERAGGVTFKRGQEGRVHIVTRNGKAEIVPHSTWLKEEPLPVVFEDHDTRAMAQAAVDAINALPESERRGQLYAPDIVRTADGYKVVEANPANEAGASGYLQDNPFIIDAYVSHLTNREPGHVRFIRDLLSQKTKSGSSLVTKKRDAVGHEHAADTGQFTSTGGGAAAKPDKPKKPKADKPKAKKPQAFASEKAARAKKAHKLVNKDIQRYAEEHNEPRLAKLVKGKSHPDSEPMDVTAKNGDLIEMKTLVDNANGKITMDSYSQVRKIAKEQETGKNFHTIVSDDQLVFNANGIGKHDDSKRVYYYRRGVAGSARIGSLHKCNEAELLKLMKTPEDQLPDAAKRTDAKLRVGKWTPFQDADGKGFKNSKTGQIFRAKK